VTAAPSVSPVRGEACGIETVSTTGAEFATSAEAAATAPSAKVSFGVTSTVTVWPLSPWPAGPRSKVSVSELVAAVVFTAVPFTFQT